MSIQREMELDLDIDNYELNDIKNTLLDYEKYSTGKDKMTYVMIPANHPEYRFPYNLEDFSIKKIT